MAVTLDFMEYGTDALAQVAYVSNIAYVSQYPTFDDDHVKATTQYDSSFSPHDTCNPANSLTGYWDGIQWVTPNGVYTNQRFHIDLGTAKIVTKFYYENAHSIHVYTEYGVKNFTLWGSNDVNSFAELTYATDTGWTQLTTSQSTFDQHAAVDAADPKYITVTNAVAYRYYAFKFANNWAGNTFMGVRRIELQTEVLNTHTESSIVEEGTYSLKVIAAITASATKTLTRTIASPIDLTGQLSWVFYIYSSRTGANIKVGLHDSGGTLTEVTPTIISAGQWQKVTVDISAVTDAHKDAIDSIIITIVDASADNTFYLDNMYAEIVSAFIPRIILIG